MVFGSTMKIYAILSDTKNPTLEEAIKIRFKKNYFDFGDGQWFVAANGTSKEIYDTLEGQDDPEWTDKDIGSVVILSTTGYYGYASSALWEWMASRE